MLGSDQHHAAAMNARRPWPRAWAWISSLVAVGCLIGTWRLGAADSNYIAQHANECHSFVPDPSEITWGLRAVTAISLLSLIVSVALYTKKLMGRKFATFQVTVLSALSVVLGIMAVLYAFLVLHDVAPYHVPCF
ncbi:MAG TPA: hypothetical protein VLW50_27285 [Streptosporangiaceae bacterium]|nr:hypothetical protein [Streptosporangiaceae bacterium]